MNILHLADLHFKKIAYDEIKKSFDSIKTIDRDIDLIVIAGDIWDAPMQNSEISFFHQFLRLMVKLAELAPIALIYGTPSHDTEGSLEVFESLHSKNKIKILKIGTPYFIASTGEITESSGHDDKLLLVGVPEPQKKWMLACGDQEDIQQAMGQIFLGLGSIRKKYQDIPCVLMYHGQVQGAKSSTGYIAGSSTSIRIEDLEKVGADYYALGDIHEPQKLNSLPAYYSGSIYPCNWGETHDAGYNYVSIEKLSVVVERISFGHPMQKKIKCSYDNIAPEILSGFKDYKGWLEIAVPREKAMCVKTDRMLEALLSSGALQGSRVTLDIEPRETVRVADIVEKKELDEKVKLWCENTGIVVTRAILEKAVNLEKYSTFEGNSIGTSIRIKRLKLRGAKGLLKNSKIDEIDLDLEGFGSGIIALIGKNGSGKTTLIENLHPWPCLLSREGKLQDHFRTHDAFRELWFTDEKNGTNYRSLITINNNAVEYYLFEDCGKGERPCSGINGRKEPYEKAIIILCGSLELYLRTAFITQRQSKYAPELQDATKGERKALLSELIGIDYLKDYAATAAERKSVLQEEKKGIVLYLDSIKEIDSEISDAIEELKTKTEEKELIVCEIDYQEQEIRKLKEEIDRNAKIITDLDKDIVRYQEFERQINGILESMDDAEKNIRDYSLALDLKKAAIDELERYEQTVKEINQLKVEKTKVDNENCESNEVYQKEIRIFREKEILIRKEVEQKQKELSAIEIEIARLLPVVEKEIDVLCPMCGQELPEDTRKKLFDEYEKKKVIVEKLKINKTELNNAINEKMSKLNELIVPKPKQLIFTEKNRLEKLETELEIYDVEKIREIISKADIAEARIGDIQKRQKENYSNLTIMRTEALIDGGRIEKGNLIKKDIEAMGKKLALATDKKIKALEENAHIKACIDMTNKKILELEKKKEKEKELDEKVIGLDKEIVEWEILEKACGVDGIQALELDAAAPTITAIANRLLSESYGTRYAIEFRTTRVGGKGAKTKQIEDFLIYILDTETGEEQEIATLSGGESVWIKRAIYDAFSIVRKRKSNTQFSVCVQDEADGALDPDARIRYLNMLLAAHKESGRYQTLLITHSIELQAMIEKTVKIENLVVGKNQEKEFVA